MTDRPGVPTLPQDEMSLAQQVALLTDEERLQLLGSESVDWKALEHDWDFWARPKQKEPEGDWRVWLILSGRGFGKTRMGAEWCRRKIEKGIYTRIHVVGATAADARDIIVEGPSGLLSVFPPDAGAYYLPTKRKVLFRKYPDAEILVFTADEPERLRGHQAEAAWLDELAAWKYPDNAWDQLVLGIRLGNQPRIIITTTPKPIPRIIKINRMPSGMVKTTGTTYENFDNLAQMFTEEIIASYEGSRLGRQEIYGDILEDAPGALWSRDIINRDRLWELDTDMERLVVSIDPAVSFDAEDGDETGIVVAGRGANGHGYVLDDLSGRWKPEEWAPRAIRAYHTHQADAIVVERNQGGDMVAHTLKTYDDSLNIVEVVATRGKLTRAEPVAALYQQGRVHHIGLFDTMEDQMCIWEPGLTDSPDRMDALVWAFTELIVSRRRALNLPAIGIDANDLRSSSHWRRSGTGID